MAKYLNNRVKDLKVGVAGKTDSENVLEVSGNISATKFIGDGSGLTAVVADQAGIKLENDDSLVGTATTVNFGTGIEVSTVSSGFATVTVTSADVGFFSSNDTGIHTTGNVGIGTTTADGAADTNNTTILNAGIVTANYFYGNGSGLTGLTGASEDTYGSSDYTPIITVDNNGRITGISTIQISGTGALANISEDTTPELGGDLYAAGYNITNAGIITSNNIEISGISTFLGNVGIGTTNAASDSVADPNNTTILNAGIVTANYFYGDGTGLSGLQGAQFDAVSQDTTPQLGGDLDLSGFNITGIGTINITGSLGGNFLSAPHGSTVTLAVTVSSKSDHRYQSTPTSAYYIDGVEAPFLTLTPGRTYRFDQSDGSNSGHRLRFYLESNKTTEYTTNVTISGSLGSDGYTEIVVTDETPIVLHYQCESHEYMGNGAQTNSNYIKTAYDSVFLGNVGVGTTNAASNSAADTNNTTILNAGIVTANYFYGDGTGLSGLQGAQFDAVSQDTNPSLGGNLDASGYNITNAGIITSNNIEISGISTFLGNVGIGTTNAANDSAADPNNTTILNVGIVTANYFYGDISRAQGLPAAGIPDISSDTTPSLGGNLDAAEYNITNAGIITGSNFVVSSGISSIGIGITFYSYSGIVSAIGYYGNFYGDVSQAQGSGISDISADTTPELGGNLDAQSYNITNVGTISASVYTGLVPERFNNQITASTHVNVNSGVGTNINETNDIFIGPDASLTFPSTAGKRYLIESIHLANKFASEVYLTATQDYNGGENVPIAQRVIVPYQGALELLKQPIIANPSDVFKMQALAGVGTTAVGLNGTLDSFITYSTVSDDNFFGIGSTVTSTSETTIFGTGISTASSLESIRLTNYSLNVDIDASISINNKSPDIRLGYLVYNLTIPKNSAVEILEKPKHLTNAQKIVAKSSESNALSVNISGVYI